MKKVWKFAVVGCGTAAHFHARAIQQLDNAQLLGVFSEDNLQCTTFAKNYNTSPYNSMDTLLADLQIDIVCICVPSGLHSKIAVEVLEAGKNAVIEKPLALTVSDCEQVAVAEKRSGKKCAVISQMRFSPTNRMIKKIIEQRSLGKIVSAGVAMKYYRDPDYYALSPWRGSVEMDGGVFMNQGIHGIDLLCFLLGGVSKVCAMAKTRLHNIKTPDTAAAVLEYQNGALGVVEATTAAYPGYPNRMEICGTCGSIVVEGDQFVRWNVPGIAQQKIVEDEVLQNGFNSPEAISIGGHRMQLMDIIDAIEQDRPPFNSTVEAQKTVELICTINKSAIEGREISLN